MTPERRKQIEHQLRQIKCAEELAGFRQGLQAQGEMQDADIYRAVWERAEQLKRVSK